VTGLVLAIAATIGLTIGATASGLRDETMLSRIQRIALFAIPALSAVLIGRGSAAGWIAAGAGIVAAALVERAGTASIRRRWWASPAAYPMLMLPFVAVGQPLIALLAAGIYAAATLTAAIEAYRKKS